MMKDKQYYVDNLNVLYEDNHLIVIEKPINVLSQKDSTNDIDINDIVKEYLKTKYNKPGNVYLGLVHRLDRRVGGVLVLAKTSKAASRISEDIRKDNIKKYYLAKATGIIKEDNSINVKILKDEKEKKAIIHKDGKDASLDYKVINYDKNDTYVYVNLHTGRYNQIRVSFSYINHPLVNDYKYSSCKMNKDELGLYCYKMVMKHPVTKEVCEFKCLPKGEIWKNVKLNNDL